MRKRAVAIEVPAVVGGEDLRLTHRTHIERDCKRARAARENDTTLKLSSDFLAAATNATADPDTASAADARHTAADH